MTIVKFFALSLDLPLHVYVTEDRMKNLGLFVTADVASILCDGVQLASDAAL